MTTTLVWITPNAEALIAKMARVSNPANQDNPNYEKLFQYLIENKHWSPFEMASMCVSIETSRGISPQILRHKSFSFQELSQRYQEIHEFEPITARRQDLKNRQSSLDDISEEDQNWFQAAKKEVEELAEKKYSEALSRGIAKESARFLLPSSVKTNLYMQGTMRSWIHYCDVRYHKDTQKEHREIAAAVVKIIQQVCPTIAKNRNWDLSNIA